MDCVAVENVNGVAFVELGELMVPPAVDKKAGPVLNPAAVSVADAEQNRPVNGVLAAEVVALLPDPSPVPVDAVPVDGVDVAKLKGIVDGVSFTPAPELLDDAVFVSCVPLAKVKTHGLGFVEPKGAVVLPVPLPKIGEATKLA